MIKKYLHHFCNYYQNNQTELFPSIEFDINNIHFKNNSYIFFLANSAQHLQRGFEPILASDNIITKIRHQLVDANKLVIKMENIY